MCVCVCVHIHIDLTSAQEEGGFVCGCVCVISNYVSSCNVDKYTRVMKEGSSSSCASTVSCRVPSHPSEQWTSVVFYSVFTVCSIGSL